VPRRVASDIPVGTQFSPALIDLKEFLLAVSRNTGDRSALQRAIWRPPVHKKRVSVPSSKRTANLPLEAAIQYGLLSQGSYDVTPLGRRLADLPVETLYEEFGRHILLRLGGLRVVEGAEQMRRNLDEGLAKTRVTGDTLAKHLSEERFRVTEHNTAINSLRMWLAEAGIFPKRGSAGELWRVNSTAKRKLQGLSDDAIGILAGFAPEQRAFVEALCRINPIGWYNAAEIRDLAEATFDVHLGRGSLPKEVLEPLRRAGLIEYQTGGTKGGKATLLRTTDLFDRDVLEVFMKETTKTLDAAVAKYYRTRPADIYAELESPLRHTKGLALEAYAIHIMRLLGLRLIQWRKRDPSGAEIDAVLAGVIGCVPTVWQLQCKNTPNGSVTLEDVSKEVGLISSTSATHVMVVTNGNFTRDARTYALEHMRRNPLTIFLLAKVEFEAIKRSPGELGAILREQAERILTSRGQVATRT
jgi:hypothetical protein